MDTQKQQDKLPDDPTPGQIAFVKAKIQAGWSAAERLSRQVGRNRNAWSPPLIDCGQLGDRNPLQE